MQIQNLWKPPVQTQKAESAERTNRLQGPEGQNVRLQSQLATANPAALKALSEKFRVDAAKDFAVSVKGSSYTKAQSSSSEGSDSFGACDSKLASKESVGSKMTRPKADADSLGRISKVAPNLGWAASDSDAAGKIGEAAGLKGLHKGAGVIGAFVAQKMGFYAGNQSGSKDVDGPAKMPSDLKSSWMTSQVRPGLLAKSQQKNEMKGGFFEVPASDTGRQRLADLLQKGAGAVGDFLKNSPVGGLLKSVEGMQGALAHGEVERMKAQRITVRR